MNIVIIFIYSLACAIEFHDRVVVTGGFYTLSTVQVYNISGPQEQLPDLRTPRSGHGCAHFLDSQNRMVTVNIIMYKCIALCLCLYLISV